MWDICRTCMSKEKEMISIFNQSKSPSINAMIMEISSLEFSPNDTLPSQMCHTCLRTLEKTYYFKKQVINCNNVLEKQARTSKFLALQVKEEREEDNVYNEQYEHVTIVDANDISTGNNAFKLDDYQSAHPEPVLSIDNDSYYHSKEVYCKSPNYLSEETSADYIKKSNSEETCIKSEKVEVEDHGVQFKDNCELIHQIVTKQEVEDDEFCSEDDLPLVELHVNTGSYDKSEDIQENTNGNDEVIGIGSEECQRVEGIECLSSNKQTKCSYCKQLNGKDVTSDVYHPLLHKCEICEKSFCSAYPLQKHMKSHTVERPFQCKHCKAGFKLAHHLTRHIRLHTGEVKPKRHKCEVCEKTFDTPSHLRKHMRIHTGEAPPKSHNCEECGTSFDSLSNLKIHMRIHTGEMPFKCEHCNARFRRSTHLCEHIRLHTGETKPKPHKCAICGSSFERPSYLLMHMRKHTGERPFKCQYCNILFKQNSSLTRHIHRMHSTEATTHSKT